ncbi:jg19641 [Pararge aegeria aegeria]|uniref:Jg19641 protein n=1 Tax=Pararge aegeria aegeria TaxID=348720 RepID=A0A8S4SBP8_9NEOP|nr:jg19641 [Pararge aegeria aegeria]
MLVALIKLFYIALVACACAAYAHGNIRPVPTNAMFTYPLEREAVDGGHYRHAGSPGVHYVQRSAPDRRRNL